MYSQSPRSRSEDSCSVELCRGGEACLRCVRCAGKGFRSSWEGGYEEVERRRGMLLNLTRGGETRGSRGEEWMGWRGLGA